MKRCFALALFVVFCASAVLAEDKVVAGMGFFHGYKAEGEDANLSKARVRLWTTTPAGFYADVDVRAEGNEIQQFFLYKKGEFGEVRVGRVFLAACYSTPAPFLSRTARYPVAAFAMAAYGTGVQYTKSSGRWSVVADVTGSSDSTYKLDSTTRLESSARVQRSGTNGKFLAGSYQVSGDFTRLALDGGIKLKVADIFAAVYYTDEVRERRLAPLVNAEWKMWVALRPHVQFDRRSKVDVWTVGVGIGKIDNLYLAIDREFGAGDGYVARAQYFFRF
jgi:hypothetical protein